MGPKDYVGGGETFPVGPMRPKQESMEFLGGRV